jgi:Spy/CpxP family protein refolding chaperone
MKTRLFSLIFILIGTSGLAAPPDRLLPPPQWWRQKELADVVKLTGEQRKKLDALSGQGEEIARLERDLQIASRELRTALEARDASAKTIVAAGERLSALRTALFSREIRLLADQRAILTQPQWMKLQEQVEQFSPPRGEGRGPGRGPGPGGRPPRF